MPSPIYSASELLGRGALPPDQEKVAVQAEELERELHALKARFDQFFLGLERKNPSRDAEDLRGRLVSLKGAFIRNTALKFRIQSLYQKFLAYDRLWQRTLKEMEDGTSRRDILRLRHKNELKKLETARSKPAGLPKTLGNADAAFEISEDLGDLDFSPAQEPAARLPTGSPLPRQGTGAPLSAASALGPSTPIGRQATSPARAPPAVPPTSTGPVPAREHGAWAANGATPAALPLGDQKLKAIYDAYITAKKRCRESTDGLTFDAVAKSLRRQVPALLQQRGVTSVDFKVVIKNGKAMLKAVPK